MKMKEKNKIWIKNRLSNDKISTRPILLTLHQDFKKGRVFSTHKTRTHLKQLSENEAS